MLPTAKTPPRASLSDMTVLIWGRPKIGKSTFCSNSEGALFLATEAGLNSLDVYQIPIFKWEDFLQACAEIAEGKHQFKTIIIDTIDNAYKMCEQYICAKSKVDHTSDLDYGKGWALVNGEFYRVLNKLSQLPYGLFMTSHAKEKEIKTRTGKYIRMVPTLPDSARGIVIGMSDIILYCDLDYPENPDDKSEPKRVMRIGKSDNYDSGDRTNRLPDMTELDYAKFVEAFMRGKDCSASNMPVEKKAEKPQDGTNNEIKKGDKK